MYEFVVNPASRSGQGKQYWKRVKAVLEERKIPYNVSFSNAPGQVREIIRNLCILHHNEKFHLVILGGDGTVNEALQGIEDFESIWVSYIPTGSSNDLARDLGISKVPELALESILKKENEITMDIGVVHYDQASLRGKEVTISDRRFAVGCGIGFDAAVCEEAMQSPVKDLMNRLKLGKLTYLGIALKQIIQAKMVNGSIRLDGKEPILVSNIFLIVTMVHKYQGGGFMFCPHAKADDGLLDVCIAANASKTKVLRILPTAYKGKHIQFPQVQQYRAKEVIIETQQPMWVHTDGEVQVQSNRICITCLKEKVRFIY